MKQTGAYFRQHIPSRLILQISYVTQLLTLKFSKVSKYTFLDLLMLITENKFIIELQV